MPRVVLLALAALGVAGCDARSPKAQEPGDPPADRVLMVSLPGISWEMVEHADLPNLDQFVANAAIGDLSTRIGRRNATITDAYLTIGAGTRAIAPDLDRAVALDPDESYGGVPASDILERRRGAVPSGIFYLAIGEALDTNEKSAYGAEVGTLGDALQDAGVGRAVVANADAAEGFLSDAPPPEGAYARSAATALMGSEGIVPEGTVGRGLLMDDPDAPFGRRLDPETVLTAFDEAWNADERTVTLVEASDLLRTAAYSPRATSAQRRVLEEQALAEADALLGQLLERVDPERDAVIVFSPVSPNASPALGIVGLQAPGIDSGLLESPTTRRAGYVQLADMAPTVLTLLGEDPPDDIEGRAFQVVDPGATGRVSGLADAADAARFRDAVLPTAVITIIAAIAVLVLATSRRDQLPSSARAVLAPVAYTILGVVPATFVAGHIGAASSSTAGYGAVVLLIGAVIGAVATFVDRRRPGLGLFVSVGAIVALVAADVIVGAPLQLNTVFGYSVGVAGRFSGLGNLAFALFGSATIVLAVLIAERGGSWGLRVAFGLLSAVVLIEGLPMLGADVGGVISMVPAFGLTALVLTGRRIRVREVIGLGLGTVAALLVFAFIDAARPLEDQTHLARFAEMVLDGHWGSFFGSLSRRWQASFGGAELAGWITVAGVLVVAGLYVILVGSGRMAINGPRWDRWTDAAAAGLAVLGVVGLIANDSSFAVPATMLIVVAPVVVLRKLGASEAKPRTAETERELAGATHGMAEA